MNNLFVISELSISNNLLIHHLIISWFFLPVIILKIELASLNDFFLTLQRFCFWRWNAFQQTVFLTLPKQADDLHAPNKKKSVDLISAHLIWVWCMHSRSRAKSIKKLCAVLKYRNDNYIKKQTSLLKKDERG